MYVVIVQGKPIEWLWSMWSENWLYHWHTTCGRSPNSVVLWHWWLASSSIIQSWVVLLSSPCYLLFTLLFTTRLCSIPVSIIMTLLTVVVCFAEQMTCLGLMAVCFAACHWGRLIVPLFALSLAESNWLSTTSTLVNTRPPWMEHTWGKGWRLKAYCTVKCSVTMLFKQNISLEVDVWLPLNLPFPFYSFSL